MHITSEIFTEQERIAPGDNWHNVMLQIYGHDIEQHQTYFPQTSQLTKEIPSITTVMFSVLKPGKKITPHKGPYNGVLRYHLGIIVPDSKNCFIKICKKKYYWYEGESIIFDDTYEHEAQNMSSEERVILFIDFYRPLPFFLDRFNKFLNKQISHSPFITNVLKKLNQK